MLSVQALISDGDPALHVLLSQYRDMKIASVGSQDAD